MIGAARMWNVRMWAKRYWMKVGSNIVFGPSPTPAYVIRVRPDVGLVTVRSETGNIRVRSDIGTILLEP